MKIAPVELDDDLVESIIREREEPPPRPRWPMWVAVGAVGTVLVVVLVQAMVTLYRQGGGASATPVGARPAQASARVSQPLPVADHSIVRLSVVTTPREATLYLNGDSVGVTPLLAHTLSRGAWTLSIRKANFTPFDTLLTLDEDAGFYVPLYATDTPAATDKAVLPAPATPRPSAQPITSPVVESPAVTPPAAKPAVSETRSQTAEPTRQADADPAPSADSRPDRQARARRAAPDAEASAEARRADSLAALAERNERQYQYLAGQGDALFNQGDYEDARATYEQMLAVKPNDAYAREMIAESRRLFEEARARQAAENDAVDEPTAASPPPAEAPSRRGSTASDLKRVPKDAGRDPEKDVTITSIHGKRTLQIGETENYRVATQPSGAPPTFFYWEAEAGVFARGRSIDAYFVKAGTYSITVTALNDYYSDKVTFDITVDPSVAPGERPAQSAAETRGSSATRRRGASSSRSTPASRKPAAEPPASAAAYDHAMLYSSKGIDVKQGGLAWVVASHLDRQAAMSDMIRYRVAGYRSGVFEDNEPGAGSIAFRVLVGQFPTEDVAAQSRDDLPADVPGSIWLLRLDPN